MAIAQSLPPASGPIQIKRGAQANLTYNLLDGQLAATYPGSAAPTSAPYYTKVWLGSPLGNIDLSSLFTGGGTGGVPSVNGITSAVSLIAGTGVGLAISGGNITLTNTGVTAFNSLNGNVSLVAGANVSLSASGNTITVSATGSSGTSGVSSLNAFTGTVLVSAGTGITVANSSGNITVNSTSSTNSIVGPVAIAAGSGIGVATSGSTITISSTGGASSSGVTSLNSQTGAVSLGAGTGIGITTSGGIITIANTGASTTLPRCTVVLLQGKTPSSTGGDSYEYVLPFGQGGATLTYTIASQHIRLGTAASSGTTSCYIDYYSGTGAFSASGSFGGASIASGNNEQSGSQTSPVATPGITMQSGGKIRANVASIGTGAAALVYEVEFTVS